MNKYQEALDFIVKSSCPSKHFCRECPGEKGCNSLAKDKIDILQELIEQKTGELTTGLSKEDSPTPALNSSPSHAKCFNCKYAHPVPRQGQTFLFLDCYCEPFKGKWVEEISQCPLESPMWWKPTD